MARKKRSGKKKSSRPNTPDQMAKIADNLWWSWQPAARELFADAAPDGYRKHHGNPVAILRSAGQ